MIVETGHYALALALAVTLLQSVLPIWGTRRGDLGLASMAVPAAITQFALVAYAFAALTYAHVVSDFSLVTVVENSLTTKPLVYKIAGVWGNHEGSMLLWVLILAIFGAAVASFGRGMADELRANTLAVQGWIAFAFLLFILLTSDPFARRFPAPFEGQDLNPLLQDPGLAIHPPLLYLGYVGFSIVFSFAAAALISGRVDAAWARYIRPWALIAWSFLTLGIAMGSYWAYYTLGWGGFWFWDPVENASLMPWLAGTALLHSAAVMEKRDALKIWTIFLAILHLLAFAARHVPGPLGRAYLGALLRQRPITRPLHPRDPYPIYRRVARSLRLARSGLATRRPVRACVSGRCARDQQPNADHLLRHRPHRYPLPSGA